MEIFYGGVWGTICDTEWDITDASVVCKQLGYSGAAAAVGMATYGEGDGLVWMDSVRCSGNETRLANCQFPGWGEGNCSHTHDAGVMCDSK